MHYFFIILLHTRVSHKHVTKLPKMLFNVTGQNKIYDKKKSITQPSQYHMNFYVCSRKHMFFIASCKIKFCTCHTMAFSYNFWHVLVIPIDGFNTRAMFSTACRGHIQKDIKLSFYFHFHLVMYVCLSLFFSVNIIQLIYVYLNNCLEFSFPA